MHAVLQALLSKPDLESRLRGIALVLHGKFNAVGWPYMNTQVMTQVQSPGDRHSSSSSSSKLWQHHHWQQQQHQP
jgi:hypothetical protein